MVNIVKETSIQSSHGSQSDVLKSRHLLIEQFCVLRIWDTISLFPCGERGVPRVLCVVAVQWWRGWRKQLTLCGMVSVVVMSLSHVLLPFPAVRTRTLLSHHILLAVVCIIKYIIYTV